MASSKSFLVPLLLVLVVLMSSNSSVIGTSTTTNAPLLKVCKFNAIYQLGDSFSDTGNQIRESSNSSMAACGRLPYSSSFEQESYEHGTPLNTVTGRCSDGDLIIDYLAMLSGLPILKPYKDTKANFKYGVNFAVSGATALPSEVLTAKHNISSPITNSSLNVQLDWMSSHFNSTCGLDQRACVEKLDQALFMVGEIGGNDYNYAIFQGKTVDEVKSMVPEVVDAIIGAVRKLMSFGATRIVVPGQLPMGCLPIYQTRFQNNIFTAYDEHKCLKSLNEFATYHNEKLQQAIDKLKQVEKPNAIIVYSNYYNAYKSLLKFGTSNGFETEKACCGIGGKYNFDTTRMCGAPDVGHCPDPFKHISWDGVHLTERANEIMSRWLIYDYLKKFNCIDY